MRTNLGLRTRRARSLTLPVLAVVMVLVVGSLGTALAAAQTFYLKSAGVPISFLSETYPTATTLANFDPGRDGEAGLLLQESSNENNETDPTKYQMWMTAPTGIHLNGPATLQFWSAMKDFDPAKKGAVKLQLLDCDVLLTDCQVITSRSLSMNPWSGGATGWVQRTITFNYVDHVVPDGRSFVVKLVVRSSSDDDMIFAYNTTAYPSQFSVVTGSPPTTTTTTTTAPPSTTTTTTTTTTAAPPPTTTTLATTTTTTTTAPPPTTTTTTTPPSVITTTSTPPTTTTTAPGPTIPPATSTTTTTIPQAVGATTTTLPTATEVSTTTTTVAAMTDPPTTTTTPEANEVDPPEDEPQHEDVALAALPLPDDAERGGSRPGGAFSNALLDGLTLVVPPAVAAALLSPLVLIEAVLAVFASTGRELLVPLVVLVAWVAWAGGRRRRHVPAAATEPSGGARHG